MDFGCTVTAMQSSHLFCEYHLQHFRNVTYYGTLKLPLFVAWCVQIRSYTSFL